MPNLRVLRQKDANGIASSEDPDQTASLGAVWSGPALFAPTFLSENLGSLQYNMIPLWNVSGFNRSNRILNWRCSGKLSIWYVTICLYEFQSCTATESLDIWAVSSVNLFSGFPRPVLTQTRLYCHKKLLEAWNFGFRKKKDSTIYVVKTKSAHQLRGYYAADQRFSFHIYKNVFSHDTAHLETRDYAFGFMSSLCS